MHTDRTTKLLLALIAAGLWTMILKPAFTPASATAQGDVIKVNIAEVGGRDVKSGAVPVEGHSLAIRPIRVEVVK